jgi:hypothetical protein
MGVGVMLAALASLACLLGGCGGGHAGRAAQADEAIARRVLGQEVTLLHRALPGRWREVASASDTRACLARGGRDRTGLASTPTIFRENLGVRVSVSLYRTATAAERAMRAIATPGCATRLFVASLRKRGVITGRLRKSARSLHGIAQGAETIELTLPTRYRGRSFTWYLDYTAVHQGRMVETLATAAGRSSAQYNHSLASWLARRTL